MDLDTLDKLRATLRELENVKKLLEDNYDSGNRIGYYSNGSY